MNLALTYGQEIEFIDADRREILLPRDATFNQKEITLVNSNGVAVNSRPDSSVFLGGEVNTLPVSTIGAATRQANTIFKALIRAGAKLNYRCNYQVHIGIPAMKESPESVQVEFLQSLQRFVYENAERIILKTMGEAQYNRPANAPTAFWEHTKERELKFHKHFAFMRATTLEEIRKAFFITEKGNYHFANLQRQYINLHTWFKYGTIEFRHFWATLDSYEASICLSFAAELIRGVLSGAPDKSFIEEYDPACFPKYLPFDAKLEKGYQATRAR